jgi:ABC-2 type transport system permease protein
MTTLTLAPVRATSPRTKLAPFTEEAVFVKRSIIHSLRTPDVIIMAIMLPVILMLLFTFVFGGAFESDGSYVDYVVPGIILLCAGFGAASVAVDVANDMTNGIIDRFRTMPMRASAVITGHVIASLLRNMVATAIVIGVGLLVGFRPNGTVLEWLGAAGLIAFYILAMTYLFAAIGLAASTPEAAGGYGFILMFVPYLSSAFVPIDTMPTWLQWIAQNQPLTPIIETIRGLLVGTPIGNEGWLSLGWIALILAVAIVWTALLFRAKAGRR